ncbi:DUF4192 domain-containing protein [Pseudonocardia charpentierae]|uniref:DUF4192 domain-containing protein n=1 Tax=Pseudonocardia charpentierae TaxID=3075545 RepID=A0ABU2N7G3_9PSEU|nr:DUF4192 domain-containing protein [Pseudonocardia sp. DSM 45834]MDT0349877.1 DUF4192 domain-containing protein [Pseudonocardia sp. DSM 45834]
MTPPGSPAPATPPTTLVTRLRNPDELLAALPYLIGFHPCDSLLFIAFGGSSGRRIELTQRVDLPPADDAPAVCRALAANVLRVAPAGVAVVVVGGDPVAAGGVPFGGALPSNDLAAVAEEALVACGVTVQSRTWAAGTGAGAAWACYDTCGCRGAVPDPDTTPFAATAVAAGLVALADRADLEKLVAPTTPGRLRRRARMLTRAVDAALDPADPRVKLGLADDPTDGPGDPVPTGHALDEAAAGRLHLDDGRVVALALALSDVEVRDAALARCAASDVDGAEHLWAALTRETPDPEAAEPAVLLAACAQLRGDGALAGIALDRAEQAWPGHRLTRLLRAVWAAGIPPERVRECLSAPEPPAMPVTRVVGRGRRRSRR